MVFCRRQQIRRATSNRLQIQLDAPQGSVKGTVETGVNVISSGGYAPRAVEPGVLLQVRRVFGKQKRGEVHLFSPVVVVELLTDFGVLDLVLFASDGGASRRALQQRSSSLGL